MLPKLKRKRALFVLTKIDEILAWSWVDVELFSLVYMSPGNSLGSDRLDSFHRLALPPTEYPALGILHLG
jgi:hypothetical protein